MPGGVSGSRSGKGGGSILNRTGDAGSLGSGVFGRNNHVGEMESVFLWTIIKESKVLAANALFASSPLHLPSAEPSSFKEQTLTHSSQYPLVCPQCSTNSVK